MRPSRRALFTGRPHCGAADEGRVSWDASTTHIRRAACDASRFDCKPGAAQDATSTCRISMSPASRLGARAVGRPAREAQRRGYDARPRRHAPATAADDPSGDVSVTSVGHRHRDDHHRRLVDRHHRDRNRAFARPDHAGHAVARAGHPGAQPVRRRQRRRRAVDMRGFGAAAHSNTLVLINGRRLNDLDMAGVDLAPSRARASSAIEITRGNSGAVLYGDGAVGGVINIVTKTGVGLPPQRADRGRLRLVQLPRRATRRSVGIERAVVGKRLSARRSTPTAIARTTSTRSTTASAISATPSRTAAPTSICPPTTSDSDLPGARRVDPSESASTSSSPTRAARRRRSTSRDKQGTSVTAGITRMLGTGRRADRRRRRAAEEAAGGSSIRRRRRSRHLDPLSAVDTHATTTSLTPRLRLNAHRRRHAAERDQPASITISRRTTSDRSHSWRAADPSLRPDADIARRLLRSRRRRSADHRLSAGSAGQRTSTARERATLRPRPRRAGRSASVFLFPAASAPVPLDSSEDNRAYHVGVEHRFTPNFARVRPHGAELPRARMSMSASAWDAPGRRSDQLRSANAEIARL